MSVRAASDNARDFAGGINTWMWPIIHLFVPIFLVMIGLSLNLRAIGWTSPFIWSLSLSLFAIAVLGKLLGASPVRGAWCEGFAIGIAMIPRDEVGLIFAQLGRTSGILNHEVDVALIIVIALTTLLSPLFLKGFYRRFLMEPS